MNRSVSAFRKIDYPERNLLINSGFDHWQSGTTFTGTNIYTTDRWDYITFRILLMQIFKGLKI